MTIYKYQCKACGTFFDRVRSIDDSDGEVSCPQCGRLGPQRVFAAFSIKSSGSSAGST